MARSKSKHSNAKHVNAVKAHDGYSCRATALQPYSCARDLRKRAKFHNQLTMKDKKNTNLTVRLDDSMAHRLERFEKTTPLGRAEITRQALDALLRHFEIHGKVVFPVEISAAPHDLEDPETASAVERYLMENEGSIMRKFMAKLESEYHKKLAHFVQSSGVSNFDFEANPVLKYWPGDYGRTIVLEGGVNAGAPAKKVGRRLLETNLIFPSDAYALKVFGWRMAPIVVQGDIIVVRPYTPELLNTDRVVAMVVVRTKDGERELYGFNRADGKEWLVSFDLEAPPAPKLKDVTIEALFGSFYSQSKDREAPTVIVHPEDWIEPQGHYTEFTGTADEMEAQQREWERKREDSD
jgi:hypothetical protein